MKMELEYRANLHRQRLNTMKPQIDTSKPVAVPHIRTNLKKEQMLEERYSAIDRENRILLNKMCEIMKPPPKPPADKRPEGPPSLNHHARKKELLRITQENQHILRRIQQAQPVYNHVEWEAANRQKVAYLKNRCEFPLILRTPRSARTHDATSELVAMDSARSAPDEYPRLDPAETKTGSVLAN